MKKRISIICLSFLMCLGFMFGFSKTYLFASAESTNIYTLSNTGEKVSVSSLETSLSGEYSTFDEAISQIENDSLNNSDTINIYFNEFDLDLLTNNTLRFENSNFTYNLSGEVSSTSENAIITLDGDSPIKLSVENITFNCENSKYAIEFKSINNNFYFGGEINYTSNYFTNFKLNNRFTASEEVLTKNIVITLPNNLFKDDVVFFNNTNSLSKVDYSEEYNYYSVPHEYYTSSKSDIASSFIKINFDLNGGKFENSYQNYNNYSLLYSSNLTLPTDNMFSKSYATFNGWFGKFEHNDVTYYFDSEMLTNFSLVNYDLSQISNYFVTDIDNLNNEKSFLSYIHREDDTNILNHAHFTFFINNNVSPSYIAKWKYNSYTINYVTNCDTISYEPETIEYLDTFETPEPSRYGYTFDGWYTDISLTNALNFNTMPSNNITLYAKWSATTHRITYHLDNNFNSFYQDYRFGENLREPSITGYEGYTFDGWYTDSSLEERFNFNTTMPAYDFSLYAKWNIVKINVYFNLMGGTFNSNTKVEVNYNTTLSIPANPTRTGYKFLGWYLNSNDTTPFDFNSPITQTINLYARWRVLSYTLSFVTNCDQTIDPISIDYGSEILEPTTTIYKTGFKFVGWYFDSNFVYKFDFKSTMPAEDFTIYARWIRKNDVTINISAKEFEYGDHMAKFEGFSDLSGFTFQYLVNGEWTKKFPTEIGTYNVKITRNEDSNYTKFEQVYENLLTISPIEKDFTWLIILFYFITAVEIAVIFFVKRMRHMKTSRNFAFFYGTSFIPTSQFIHIIISGIICIIGFIYLCYELFKTHRAAYNDDFAKSDKDNRERFKEDLKFQINTKTNPDFEYETTTKESFGDRYSKEDIERMLLNDTYNEDRLKSKTHSAKSISSSSTTIESENHIKEASFNANSNLEIVSEMKVEDESFEETTNTDELETTTSQNNISLFPDEKFDAENYNAEEENERYRREMYDYDINQTEEDEPNVENNNEEVDMQSVNDRLARQNRELEELSKQMTSQNIETDNNDL